MLQLKRWKLINRYTCIGTSQLNTIKLEIFGLVHLTHRPNCQVTFDMYTEHTSHFVRLMCNLFAEPSFSIYQLCNNVLVCFILTQCLCLLTIELYVTVYFYLLSISNSFFFTHTYQQKCTNIWKQIHKYTIVAHQKEMTSHKRKLWLLNNFFHHC